MTCVDVTLPPVATHRPLLLVVAAALIDKENKILLAQRPAQKSFGSLWEFPGGKIEPFETPEVALTRELKEELAIETSVGCLWPLGFASHAYADFHLLMPLFSCRIWQGTPIGKEGQKLAWVTKEEIRHFAMPPADKPLVESLWHFL